MQLSLMLSLLLLPDLCATVWTLLLWVVTKPTWNCDWDDCRSSFVIVWGNWQLRLGVPVTDPSVNTEGGTPKPSETCLLWNIGNSANRVSASWRLNVLWLTLLYVEWIVVSVGIVIVKLASVFAAVAEPSSPSRIRVMLNYHTNLSSI